MPLNNKEMDEVLKLGPGTSSGEVFRRYWLPVETSANLDGGKGSVRPSAKNPVRVKALGENLVLFRDATGKPGLLEEHCSHRGTSLVYGRVEDDGLRCLYHGWLYDREGNCLDMPCEPPGRRFRNSVKHPSYPCVEVGGLIFAYMGPPELQPPFPRYPALFRQDGMRVTGKGNRIQKSNALLQTLDNVLDVWHREVAHGWFKGGEPVYALHHGRNGDPATPIRFETTPWGACYVTLQNTREQGVYEYHETHALFPCQRARTNTINWAVPMDDPHDAVVRRELRSRTARTGRYRRPLSAGFMPTLPPTQGGLSTRAGSRMSATGGTRDTRSARGPSGKTKR